MKKIYNWNSVYRDSIQNRKISGHFERPSVARNFVLTSCVFLSFFLFSSNAQSQTYCAASGIDAEYERISNVTIGSINNNSTSDSGYEDFSSISTSLAKEVTHAFSATASPVDPGDQLIVWIDFNQNGSFEDAGEKVFTSTVSGGPYLSNILIPSTALLGSTKMRVRLHYASLGGNTTSCGPSDYGEVEDYTVIITAPPSCSPPTALTSSAITSNSATLSWTAPSSAPASGYEYYYSTTNSAPIGTTTPTGSVAAGVTTVNITALTPSTSYYYWVRSKCTLSESSSWIAGNFATPCTNISTFPFVESFDATSATLSCWTVSAGAGASINWGVTTADATYGAAAAASTARFAYLNVYNAQSSYNTYNIFTPRFALDASPKRLTYNYFLGNLGYKSSPAPLAVYISVEGGAFTSIYSHTDANSTFATLSTSPWQFNSIDLTPYAGQTIQLAFVSNSNYGSGRVNQGIDQVTVENIPNCLPPTLLASSAITTSSATLTWTSSITSPSNGYDIYYSTTNTAPLAATTPTVNNYVASPYSATGLSPSSTYYWWVRSDCGAETSSWASGGSFSTLCNAVATLPYLENFDTYGIGSTAFPNCWSRPVTFTSGSVWPSIVAANPVSTPNSLRFQSEVGIATYAVSPAFSADLHTLRVAFMMKREGANSGTMAIGVMSDPSDINTFELVQTINPTDNNMNQYIFNLNATVLTGANRYIALRHNSTLNNWYYWVDNFKVEIIPTCSEPVALSASNMGFNSADLSWTSGGTSFDVEWGASGFAQGSGQIDNGVGNPYLLSGLQPNTTYSYYVRNVCGGSDGNSTWSGPYSFSTLRKATVTWTESFATSTLPLGWTNGGFSVGATGALTPGTTTSYLYKNLYASSATANVQSIYVGDLGANDRLKFNYKLGNYSSPYAPPAVDSGNFIVEIQQYPSVTWTELATVSNNGVAGWQEVSYNLAAYAGEIVKIRITANRTAGDYYIGFDNFTIDPICPSGVWVGTTPNFNTASNWADNMVPEACTTVSVTNANPMVIGSDATVNSITLGATASVTVNGTLNVGNISIAEGGQLTIANDAALLQSASAVNTGNATVIRNSNPLFRQDYTLWSSPVTGQKLRAFSPATLFNRFSSYDTAEGPNGDYVQEIVTTNDMNTKMFGLAKGYLIRMPNNWVINGEGAAAPYVGMFKGTLNNGNVSVALSGAKTRMNLVGNPYPSAISIEDFWTANASNIDATAYFWRKTNGAAGSGYVAYNLMGATNGSLQMDNIKTGQGFFVVASSAAPGNLVFNNDMRASTGTSNFYKSASSSSEIHRIWLNLSDATDVVGQALIGYASGATQDVDNGFDTKYFNDSPLALTSLINNNEYSIQGRSLPFVNTDVVPLGFKSDVVGNFTISLASFDGVFADNQDIFLRDNATNTFQNLKLADYTFTTQAGVFNDRFEVQYNSTLSTENPSMAVNNILIGVKDQQIKINAGSIEMQKIELIDVTGRVIYTLNGIAASTVTIDTVAVANQMLIVRISTTANGVVNQKIIF